MKQRYIVVGYALVLLQLNCTSTSHKKQPEATLPPAEGSMIHDEDSKEESVAQPINQTIKKFIFGNREGDSVLCQPHLVAGRQETKETCNRSLTARKCSLFKEGKDIQSIIIWDDLESHTSYSASPDIYRYESPRALLSHAEAMYLKEDQVGASQYGSAPRKDYMSAGILPETGKSFFFKTYGKQNLNFDVNKIFPPTHKGDCVLESLYRNENLACCEATHFNTLKDN